MLEHLILEDILDLLQVLKSVQLQVIQPHLLVHLLLALQVELQVQQHLQQIILLVEVQLHQFHINGNILVAYIIIIIILLELLHLHILQHQTLTPYIQILGYIVK